MPMGCFVVTPVIKSLYSLQRYSRCAPLLTQEPALTPVSDKADNYVGDHVGESEIGTGMGSYD
ncbi:hypothetical protein BDY19DRAFT_979439 [Irpex rosettiformis]|uniref:Uncharacterized protein n=1 Tax=Irpex rosettiformis TaxID=378272 RepID=A0ACB8TMS3_9APHY|nr:hypothetical protein BDY19DRAFT_979439 [Irpex rosettiformis]